MKIAFILFEGITTLDFIGVYDPLTRLSTMGFMPDLKWETCALSPEVKDNTGLTLKPDRVGGPLGEYDVIIVPGGFGTRNLVQDETFLAWLKTAGDCKLIASVCTGSLLLGAAGFLTEKKATTHPNAYQGLIPYCAEVKSRRIVDEGTVITAGGVTSSIDLGLYLCEKLAGAEAKEKIRRQMDYPY